MGQYVGIERQAFGGHRPTLTPTSRWRAPSCRTPMGESGTINRKSLLIRLRPFTETQSKWLRLSRSGQ